MTWVSVIGSNNRVISSLFFEIQMWTKYIANYKESVQLIQYKLMQQR